MKSLKGMMFFVAVGSAWLALAGCGGSPAPVEAVTGYQPVHGKVLDADGKPFSGGLVMFEGGGEPGSVAKGEIGTDGAFKIDTYTEKPQAKNSGAVAASYNVFVKSADGKTSYHLKQKFQVKGGDNDFPIQLKREAYYP